MLLADITAPLVLLAWPSTVPTVVTPLAAPSTLVGVQVVPFQMYCWLKPLAMVTPCMVKLVVPTLDTKTIRPAVVLVGAAKLKVWPAVV